METAPAVQALEFRCKVRERLLRTCNSLHGGEGSGENPMLKNT
jgi:hypothetical protein